MEAFALISFLVILLLQAFLCFSGVTNGQSLKIVKSEALDQLTEHVLLQDQIRVDSIQGKIADSSDAQFLSNEVPVKQGAQLNIGTGNYIVQLGFGTPTKSMSLVFDTESDLTWIQCEPCSLKHCYKGPKFDRKKSTSYSKISCNTTQCEQFTSTLNIFSSCGVYSTCNYRMKHSASSYSLGHFGSDTLTLAPSNVWKNFEFGCGLSSRGPYRNAAGVLALSRSKLSFVSQTFMKSGGVFSYCLPSTSTSTGYLSLGAEKAKDASVKFTPIVLDKRRPYSYFVKMTTIMFMGKKLPISPSVFALSGMIIDSGTSVTRLPPTAYAALKSAFEKYMSNHPKAKPLSILDTCYDVAGDELLSIPQIHLVFEGNVEVYLDSNRVIAGTNASQVCLAFAANKAETDVAILGNMQQKKLKIVYDIPKMRLGFGGEDCS